MKSSTPVLNLLLVICSITLTISVVLAAYVIYSHQEIGNLKATLLSKNELQAELLSGQELEQSLLPHLVDEIGFVLNPFLKRSAFRAAKGDVYPVNSLGLRGNEISRKQPGVTRILIVGDSIVFGWKLKEQDRLSNILEKYTSESYDAENKVEFITIAMPGWNVRSERAFLENHLLLLDPDLIVWQSISNDVEDVAGVVPPGILASWVSPHAKDHSPFTGISAFHKRMMRFIPTASARLAQNIELIVSFRTKYKIPIILLGLPGIRGHKQADLFADKQIHIPKKYHQQQNWRLSASDGHPTAWANRIIALGILDKLMQLEFIPSIDFKPEDKAIIQDYHDFKPFTPKQKKRAKKFAEFISQIPTQFVPEQEFIDKSVLYDIDRTGYMSKAGILLLKDPGHSSYLNIIIEPLFNIKKYPGNALFTVRNQALKETNTAVKINSRQMQIQLNLPKERVNSPVYEISWKFDYQRCWGPSKCSIGKMVQASFEQ